jgi:hypothetical protein
MAQLISDGINNSTNINIKVDNTNRISANSSGDVDVNGILTATYLNTSTAFSDKLTNITIARLTGVLDPVLTLPSTAGKEYLIHSIHVSNIARIDQETAGASATVATTGFATVKNIGAADALRTAGTYTIPSDKWTTSGSGTEAAFTIVVDGTGAATVTITSAGIGFAVDETITVTDANLGVGGAPNLTFQVATLTGVIQSVNLLTTGQGYITPPTVSFDAGTTGTGAIITSEVDSDGRIIRLNLINRGSAYVADDGNLLRIAVPPQAQTEIGISGRFDTSSPAVQSYFAFDVPIPKGGATEILKQPQILGPSDVIRMQGYASNGSGLNAAADVFITYEEVDNALYQYAVASLTTTTVTDIIQAPSTKGLLIRSIRLTNTEFVGDYDVSVLINNGTTSFYLIRNLIIPSFATVEICDTPKRINSNWKIQLEAGVVGQDVNISSSIDVQVSAKILQS